MHLLRWIIVVLVVAGCGAAPPPGAPFTKIDLPAGAEPVRIVASGDALLVGVHRDGKPGLLKYESGRVTDIPLTPATGYGEVALWYSLTARDGEILAVGGKRGGAHGNVRWSVWRGTEDGIAEQPQAFSTFGGLGAGDLVDGVLTDGGAFVVGTWQSGSAGSDAAVWTTDGVTWQRRSSAGTALESTRESLKFPMAATSRKRDVVIAGWQLVKGRQQPIVWTLTDAGVTVTALPDSGRTATAITVTCADTCEIAGRVDGRLAVWRGAGNDWRRVADVPDVPVGDRDRPPAPAGGTLAYTDRGTVHVGSLGGPMRAAHGPSGVVTAVARVGDSTYVLAAPDGNKQILWRAD